MTLATAKKQVKIAIKIREYGIDHNLKSNYNYPLIAYNKYKNRLIYEDREKFEVWFNKIYNVS
jgi:hypothetical protein